MKLVLTTMTGLLVACIANIAVAEGMPESLRKHIENNFIGKWGTTITYDGETSKGTYTGKWSPGKHCLVINERSSGPQGEVHSSGILGWESQSKSVVHYGFLSDGSHFAIRYSKIDGEKWTGKISGLYQGQTYESPASVDWKGDSFEYRDMMLDKPFIFKAVRRQRSDGEKAFKAYADLAVGGVWTSTADGQTFEDSYERILDGRFVRLRSKGTGDFPEQISIFGVDPVTEKFTWRGFGADGSVVISTSTLLDDVTWGGNYHRHGPKGSARSKFRLTKVDSDTIKLEVFEQFVKGADKPFPFVSIWKRKR
jgi:hypothetical protein